MEIDYEKIGKGLVYNCEGKHWACVNKNEYFNCKKNEELAKDSNAKSPCGISDVYASENDCKEAQLEKINNLSVAQVCQ